jgi:hypothetical protein
MKKKKIPADCRITSKCETAVTQTLEFERRLDENTIGVTRVVDGSLNPDEMAEKGGANPRFASTADDSQ